MSHALVPQIVGADVRMEEHTMPLKLSHPSWTPALLALILWSGATPRAAAPAGAETTPAQFGNAVPKAPARTPLAENQKPKPYAHAPDLGSRLRSARAERAGSMEGEV